MELYSKIMRKTGLQTNSCLNGWEKSEMEDQVLLSWKKECWF